MATEQSKLIEKLKALVILIEGMLDEQDDSSGREDRNGDVVFAVGSTPHFIKSNHIDYVRPCKQTYFDPGVPNALRKCFGLTTGSRELIFHEETPGLTDLLSDCPISGPDGCQAT